MAKKRSEKENYLDKVPYIPENFKWEKSDDGSVTLYIENKGLFNKIAQKLFKKPKFTQIHLDETGSFVWPLIDGEKSIYELGKEVKEHFGDKAEPLYETLAKYFHIL